MKQFLFLISTLVIVPFLKAQEEVPGVCQEQTNQKAKSLYEKGSDKKKYKKPERMEFLAKAIELDPTYADAYFTIAKEIIVKCKLDALPFAPAVPFFLKAVEFCPQIHSEPYYFIGFHYYETSRNDSAIFWLDKFIKFKDDDEKKFAKDYEAEMYQAKEMIKQAKKENELKKKIVPFSPRAVKEISTESSEYLPYISPDGNLFLFTRTQADQSLDKVFNTDKEREIFCFARKKSDGNFDRGNAMESPFNQNANEGGASLTIDNKCLYYAQTRYDGATGQSNTDIYYATFDNGSWNPIQKVPTINDPVFWDSQPTVSSDGNTIIFASNRPGGFGKVDLYKTIRDPLTKRWGTPINLGPKINTPGTEKTPFMHSDSETLYFSSDGHYGFGDADIFYVRKDKNGEWGTPENIGSPINGEGDDAGLLVSTDGKKGYFSSWNEGKVAGLGSGKYDIYEFDLYKEARPEEVVFVKGQIKQEENEHLGNFIVEIKNSKTKEKTLAVVDSTNGEYMAAISLKKNKNDLIVTAKASEHAFVSQVIKFDNKELKHDSIKAENLEIKKAIPGKSIVLNNIYYATGAADLYAESFVVLDEFAEYLKENPKLMVEIQGHTDNVGNESANILLSEKRAETVVKYLHSKGVNPKNTVYRGYGPKIPIASNNTTEGKSKNRRTEFKILANE